MTGVSQQPQKTAGSGDSLVLYIGGDGRSGSTLLSAMLGNYPGFWPVGEVRGIWHAIQTDELCGCGTPFSECDFWISVGERIFGGWNHVDVDEMLRLDAAYVRHRFVTRLLVPPLRRKHAAGLGRYEAVLGSIYSTIREVSGCAVIVDSTKDPPYAFLLHSAAGINLRLVHLVRDSRGVAHSWAKKGVARPEYDRHPTLSQTPMNRRGLVRSALEWDAKNALLHWLQRCGVPRLLIRYESLVDDPNGALRRVLAFVDQASGSAPQVEGASRSSEEYESLPHHAIGGNRLRFARGIVRVQADEEWKRAMPRWQQALVGVATLPFLAGYGYLGRRVARTREP